MFTTAFKQFFMMAALVTTATYYLKPDKYESYLTKQKYGSHLTKQPVAGGK